MSRSGDLLSFAAVIAAYCNHIPDLQSGESLTALLVEHGAIACADLLDLREIGAGDLQPNT
jgi:hypothetical protein